MQKRLKLKKQLRLPDDCRYTMLVAWHKFDRYERWRLCGMMQTTLYKLPFVPVIDVWSQLKASAVQQKYYTYIKTSEPPVPYEDWMKRICNSVNKEMRKKSKRVRLRIEV